ncbi:MAG: hypothetical protein K9H14_01830 [Actinomycetia bacterium]|nr:hypothetical protein [Actinomycetes bacterium]
MLTTLKINVNELKLLALEKIIRKEQACIRGAKQNLFLVRNQYHNTASEAKPAASASKPKLF